jgi:outer membrane protein assembly factor BamB
MSNIPRRGRTLNGIVLSMLSCCIAAVLPAQEWTRFRGPNGTGIGEAPHLPARWNEADLDWKVSLPGTGHSSPVLWGEKIFIGSAEGEGARRLVLCLSAEDGRILWSLPFEAAPFGKHPRNSHASSTPTVDADRVYAVVPSPGSVLVVGLDHAGNFVWRRDLGPFKAQHGYGTSPIVFEDLVVIANEQDGESFVAALDARTGEVKWKAPRRTSEAAYGTPCSFDDGGRPSLILSSHAHGIAAIDARTGEPLWEAPLLDKRAVSSPVIAGGLAIATCGSGGGGNYLIAVRPAAKLDAGAGREAWRLSKAIAYVPTPLAKDDLLFSWGDGGIVTCVEIPSGKVIWQERAGGNYSGSPVWAAGRLYAISEDGEVVAIAAGRKFEVISRTPLGEASRSTPAVAGGRLFLRTASHLMALGGKFRPPASGPRAEPAPPAEKEWLFREEPK